MALLEDTIVDPREGLPPQQRKVLEFIEEYIDISGYPPAIADIADFLGVSSTFGVRKHIDALIRKGFIARGGAGLSRALRPTRKAEESSVPIVGQVTAGHPILAVENIEGWLGFRTANMSKKMFGLRVKGESMKDKGILNGDLVIVQQQNEASDGDIVVALLDDSATVKTFRKKGKTYELEPANDLFSPIPILPDTAFQILGKVTSVIRMIDEKKPGVFQFKYS